MDTSDITIIILDRDAGARLDACLRALVRQIPSTTPSIVVGAGGGEEAADLTRRHMPSARVLSAPEVTGLAAARQAVGAAKTSIIAVVDTSVVVRPGWLAELTGTVAAHPSAGIAGGKLYGRGGSQLLHAGGFLHFPLAFVKHFGNGEPDVGQFDTPRGVPFASGAAMVFRRELLAKVGPFDAGFHRAYSDVDFCVRARRNGYVVRYNPSATAVWEPDVPDLTDYHRDRWRFLLKHYVPSEIVKASLPAEQDWLASFADAAAMASVYPRIRRELPGIWRSRARDGATLPSEAQKWQIVRALVVLQQVAWQEGGLKDLAERGRLAAFNQRDGAPLLARLRTALRSLWSQAAIRHYGLPLVAQQRDFNEAVANRMGQQQTKFAQFDHNQASLVEAMTKLRGEMEALAQRLNSIDDRLGRLTTGPERDKN